MKRALGLVGTVLVLNILFNWMMVRKNAGEKYLDTYLSQQQQVKVLERGFTTSGCRERNPPSQL